MKDSKPSTEHMRQTWEKSFSEQISQQTYNAVPVESIVRNVSYYLRNRYQIKDYPRLKFLEVGCGTGPNLIWLAQKGIRVSGVDIAASALQVARERFQLAELTPQIDSLLEASVTDIPLEDASFDGIIESCVFQHLNLGDRRQAFGEVSRLLKKGGVFVGYMLSTAHTVYEQKKALELPEDRGTVILEDGKSNVYLTNIGLSHFFSRDEYPGLLQGFSVVEALACDYYLPTEEARHRGYSEYKQGMWMVYAVK